MSQQAPVTTAQLIEAIDFLKQNCDDLLGLREHLTQVSVARRAASVAVEIGTEMFESLEALENLAKARKILDEIEILSTQLEISIKRCEGNLRNHWINITRVVTFTQAQVIRREVPALEEFVD